MTRKSFFVLFLLLASLASKSQEPDPSWELSLNEATPYWDYMPMNLLELDDGNYLVPLVSTQEYQKTLEDFSRIKSQVSPQLSLIARGKRKQLLTLNQNTHYRYFYQMTSSNHYK